MTCCCDVIPPEIPSPCGTIPVIINDITYNKYIQAIRLTIPSITLNFDINVCNRPINLDGGNCEVNSVSISNNLSGEHYIKIGTDYSRTIIDLDALTDFPTSQQVDVCDFRPHINLCNASYIKNLTYNFETLYNKSTVGLVDTTYPIGLCDATLPCCNGRDGFGYHGDGSLTGDVIPCFPTPTGCCDGDGEPLRRIDYITTLIYQPIIMYEYVYISLIGGLVSGSYTYRILNGRSGFSDYPISRSIKYTSSVTTDPNCSCGFQVVRHNPPLGSANCVLPAATSHNTLGGHISSPNPLDYTLEWSVPLFWSTGLKDGCSGSPAYSDLPRPPSTIVGDLVLTLDIFDEQPNYEENYAETRCDGVY